VNGILDEPEVAQWSVKVNGSSLDPKEIAAPWGEVHSLNISEAVGGELDGKVLFEPTPLNRRLAAEIVVPRLPKGTARAVDNHLRKHPNKYLAVRISQLKVRAKGDLKAYIVLALINGFPKPPGNPAGHGDPGWKD
jgi:hypothetical protein